jgi:hypothetical protein
MVFGEGVVQRHFELALCMVVRRIIGVTSPTQTVVISMMLLEHCPDFFIFCIISGLLLWLARVPNRLTRVKELNR